MTKPPAMPEPTQEQLDAPAAHADYHLGWFNLDWSRCMAKRAASEFAALQSAQPAEVSDAKWEGAEEWMPLAWELCADECGEEACTELVWEGGPIPEPWGDRWLKYEDEAKRLIELVRKHVPSLRPQAVPMTDRVFDLICNAIDEADTLTMEGDYMMDSDDCIAVVRVMQALLHVHYGITQRADGGEKQA